MVDTVFQLEKRIPDTRKLFVQHGQNVEAATQQVKLRITPVAWGVPMDEVCFSLWMINFVRLPVMPWDVMINTVSTYLPDARNGVHQRFLEDTDVKWLFMLDSDVLPPPSALDKLIAHNLPIVGGWYRVKGGKSNPVVYDYLGPGDDGKEHWKQRQGPGEGLEQVDGAGAGCWLMTRETAKALGPKPYSLVRGGEDLELCLKLKELGIPVHIDWSIACAHAGVAMV